MYVYVIWSNNDRLMCYYSRCYLTGSTNALKQFNLGPYLSGFWRIFLCICLYLEHVLHFIWNIQDQLTLNYCTLLFIFVLMWRVVLYHCELVRLYRGIGPKEGWNEKKTLKKASLFISFFRTTIWTFAKAGWSINFCFSSSPPQEWYPITM